MFDFTELIVCVGVLLLAAILLLAAPLFPKVGAAFLRLIKPYRDTLKPSKRQLRKVYTQKECGKIEKTQNNTGHVDSDQAQVKDKTEG